MEYIFVYMLKFKYSFEFEHGHPNGCYDDHNTKSLLVLYTQQINKYLGYWGLMELHHH